MSKNKTWEDCPREDLNQIPAMMQAGWTPEFHHEDARHGRNVPENAPCNAVRFTKGNKITWKIYYEAPAYNWAVADLINGHNYNHRKFHSLEDVRLHESE